MKRKETFYILLVFLTSAILRFWGLGIIPAGLSLDEINFALFTSNIFGNWVLSSFWLRLPFAVVGTIEVLLFYFLLRKLGQSSKFSCIGAFILAVLPWHVQVSRIYSQSLIAFGVFLLCVYLSAKCVIGKNKRLLLLSFLIGISIFLFSVFQTREDQKTKVDQQRNMLAGRNNVAVKFFSNKYMESYRYNQKLLFENLDFGNYFFSGHPRERWGIEETQKLYFVFLPLIVLGLLKVNSQTSGLLVISAIFSLFLPITYGPEFNIFLLLPVVFLSLLGIEFIQSLKRGKLLCGALVLLFVFEFSTFVKGYFGGHAESQFSPRRDVFQKVVEVLKKNVKSGERIQVSERLGISKPYFDFYTKTNPFYSLEFKDFDIRHEKDLDKLFVDVLPDDPASEEPLLKKNGDWPYHIGVIQDFYDMTRRQTVVIYRYR